MLGQQASRPTAQHITLLRQACCEVIHTAQTSFLLQIRLVPTQLGMNNAEYGVTEVLLAQLRAGNLVCMML
jgi:hypothetical protein